MTLPLDGIIAIQAASFERTRWSLVRRAACSRDRDDSSLDEFCRTYWYPLFAAARSRGLAPSDACDVVQILFEVLVRKDSLRKADPERGRLRAWLLTLLNNLVRDGVRAARAEKRGGGAIHFPLDSAAAEIAWQTDPSHHESPDDIFRKNLAACLLEEAVEALAAHYIATRSEALFDALLPALEGPLPDSTYAEAAVGLGITPGAVRMAVLRFRERFRKILREKAARVLGVSNGPALDRELRELFA